MEQKELEKIFIKINSKYDSYFNKSSIFLNLKEFFETHPTKVNTKVRTNRGSYKIVEEGDIKFVLRKYKRGGFIRHFIKDLFFLPYPFSIKESRSYIEYDVLNYLYLNNVNVPEPLYAVYYKKNKMFYMAYISTKYIDGSINFLEYLYSSYDKERAEEIAFLAGVEVSKMIKLNVMHVDLHAGNILFNPKEKKVFLIDFDKAFRFKGELPFYKDLMVNRLVNRFFKSSLRHNFSNTLVKNFKDGLGKFL